MVESRLIRVVITIAGVLGFSLIFAVAHYAMNGREDRAYPAFAAAFYILSVVGVVSAFETSRSVGAGLLLALTAIGAVIWFTLGPVAECVTRVLESRIL